MPGFARERAPQMPKPSRIERIRVDSDSLSTGLQSHYLATFAASRPLGTIATARCAAHRMARSIPHTSPVRRMPPMLDSVNLCVTQVGYVRHAVDHCSGGRLIAALIVKDAPDGLPPGRHQVQGESRTNSCLRCQPRRSGGCRQGSNSDHSMTEHRGSRSLPCGGR